MTKPSWHPAPACRTSSFQRHLYAISQRLCNLLQINPNLLKFLCWLILFAWISWIAVSYSRQRPRLSCVSYMPAQPSTSWMKVVPQIRHLLTICTVREGETVAEILKAYHALVVIATDRINNKASIGHAAHNSMAMQLETQRLVRASLPGPAAPVHTD